MIVRKLTTFVYIVGQLNMVACVVGGVEHDQKVKIMYISHSTAEHSIMRQFNLLLLLLLLLLLVVLLNG